MADDIICEQCGVLVDCDKYNWHLKCCHKQKQEVRKEHLCESCHKTFSSKSSSLLFGN